ncbi:MAG: hypothetical protein FWH55_01165, partial [Oscillospiraceae bacterium]|nr:hypothetical protein [Oscillospiraceae bacterium]
FFTAEKRTKKGAGGSGPPGPLNGQGQAPGPQNHGLTQVTQAHRKNIHTVFCLPQEGMIISMLRMPRMLYLSLYMIMPF